MKYAVRYKTGGTWHWKANFCCLTFAKDFILRETTASIWHFYKVLNTGMWEEIK